jgi:hypothetical protein
MTIDIFTLRNLVRQHTGEDTNTLPDTPAFAGGPSCDMLLNRSWWEIIYKFQFREKEVDASFQTVEGQAFYSLPSPFEAIRQVAIEDPYTYQHTTLAQTTIYRYQNLFNNEPNQSFYGKPVQYVREGCGIYLLPTPDQVYNMDLKYWTVLADLGGVSNPNSPIIPQIWHECILYGAVYRTFFQFLDYERGAYMQSIHGGIIDKIPPVQAKEEADQHDAGVNVKGRSSGYEGQLAGTSNSNTGSIFDGFDYYVAFAYGT